MTTILINGRRMTLAEFEAAKGLTVGGDLRLDGCTGLTSLPESLTVGGSLWLNRCTGLTSLPEGLTVGGDLSLTGCTGLRNILRIGPARGNNGQDYRTIGVMMRDGAHVIRGCRNYDIADARKHWAENPEVLRHVEQVEEWASKQKGAI